MLATSKLKKPWALLVSLGILQPVKGFGGRKQSTDRLPSSTDSRRPMRRSYVVLEGGQSELYDMTEAEHVRKSFQQYVTEGFPFEEDVWNHMELLCCPPGSHSYVWTEGDVAYYWCNVVIPALLGEACTKKEKDMETIDENDSRKRSLLDMDGLPPVDCTGSTGGDGTNKTYDTYKDFENMLATGKMSDLTERDCAPEDALKRERALRIPEVLGSRTAQPMVRIAKKYVGHLKPEDFFGVSTDPRFESLEVKEIESMNEATRQGLGAEALDNEESTRKKKKRRRGGECDEAEEKRITATKLDDESQGIATDVQERTKWYQECEEEESGALNDLAWNLEEVLS